MIKLENIEEKIIKEKEFLLSKSKNYKENFLVIQNYIKNDLNIEELKKKIQILFLK